MADESDAPEQPEPEQQPATGDWLQSIQLQGKRALNYSKSKIAREAIKQALKSLVRAIAANPYTWAIVAALIGLFLIILLIAGLAGFNPAVRGTTDTQSVGAEDLADIARATALAGSEPGLRVLLEKRGPQLLERIELGLTQARRQNNANLVTVLERLKQALEVFRDSNTTKAQKDQALQTIKREFSQVASLYPEVFEIHPGESGKIVAQALRYTSSPSLYSGCRRVSDRTACNQFVNEVVRSANGYDLGFRSANEIYLHFKDSEQARLKWQFLEPIENLKPGDVLLDHRPLARHGHVAIYLGDGLTAEASLGKREPSIRFVKKRNDAVRFGAAARLKEQQQANTNHEPAS